MACSDGESNLFTFAIDTTNLLCYIDMRLHVSTNNWSSSDLIIITITLVAMVILILCILTA